MNLPEPGMGGVFLPGLALGGVILHPAVFQTRDVSNQLFEIEDNQTRYHSIDSGPIFEMTSHMKYLIPTLLVLLLAGCATHPLGMTDTEWASLTPRQQLEASREQAHIDNERRLKQMEIDLKREELRHKQERLELETDVANGMIARRTEICIGGPKCPGSEETSFILPIGQFAYVDKVVFQAHDRIGRRHGAKVDIYADRQKVADSIDIKKDGTRHEVFVGMIARNIVIKETEDDEVRFKFIKVFGEKLDASQMNVTIIK